MEAETKHYVADMNDAEVVHKKLPTKKRTCYRPGRGTPKSELREIHKLKMEMKRQRNAQQTSTGFGLPVRENKSKKWDDNEV